MAKTKKAASRQMSFTERFNIPKNEAEHVQNLITATERVITNQGTELDSLFSEQAARLRRRLADLKRKK